MNPGRPKITFIGAGSATFTRTLIGDVLSYPELRGATISLHDIDPERLETAAGVARVTAEEAGAAPEIEAPWFMHDDEEIELMRIPVSDYLPESEENLAEYERTRELLAAGEALPIEPSIEYAPQIIHSIETGLPRVIYGNVENAGLIDNLPRGACVEVPCVVDSSGVHPTHVGELPPQLAALNRTFLNVAELTVRAALESRPEHVLQAALLDPNTAASLTVGEIERLVAELTEAHGEALPEALRAPALARRQGE